MREGGAPFAMPAVIMRPIRLIRGGDDGVLIARLFFLVLGITEGDYI